MNNGARNEAEARRKKLQKIHRRMVAWSETYVANGREFLEIAAECLELGKGSRTRLRDIQRRRAAWAENFAANGREFLGLMADCTALGVDVEPIKRQFRECMATVEKQTQG